MFKKRVFIAILFFSIIISSCLSPVICTPIVYGANSTSKAPNINARHAVVLDRSSKTILYGKKENEQCKMASTTKIMTAIVVIENANLKDTVKVSKKAASTGGSRLGLSTNCQITVENLLYGLMLKSGNDTAVALAEHVGGSVEGFAELMNKKAEELGLLSTHFVTPHGLDSNGHYTTAYELAILADYALQNKTFSKIVSTKSYTVKINNNTKTINNTNELLGNLEGVYGVKTGFTNGANRCLVTSCKRGDLDIICVVLGCDTKKDRTKDSINLINYIFKNFSMVNIKDIINSDFEKWSQEHKNSFTINKGVSQSVELKLDDVKLPYSKLAINNNDIDKISSSVSFNSYFEAPLPSNSCIGSLSFNVGDITYFTIDILNLKEIKKKHIFNYFFDFIKKYSLLY